MRPLWGGLSPGMKGEAAPLNEAALVCVLGGGKTAPGMRGRLRSWEERLSPGESRLRPGMKGRVRPWDGRLRPGIRLRPSRGDTAPGMRLSPGIKGTLHPGVEMSPWGGRLRQGSPFSSPGVPRLLRCSPRQGGMVAPGTALRPLLEGTASAREALRLGEGRVRPWHEAAPPRIQLHPGRPRVPSRGRRVRVGCSAPRAARGGEVPAARGGRLEPSGTIWGDWGPEVNSDVFTSAVGKLPGCGWVRGKVSH